MSLIKLFAIRYLSLKLREWISNWSHILLGMSLRSLAGITVNSCQQMGSLGSYLVLVNLSTPKIYTIQSKKPYRNRHMYYARLQIIIFLQYVLKCSTDHGSQCEFPQGHGRSSPHHATSESRAKSRHLLIWQYNIFMAVVFVILFKDESAHHTPRNYRIHRLTSCIIKWVIQKSAISTKM